MYVNYIVCDAIRIQNKYKWFWQTVGERNPGLMAMNHAFQNILTAWFAFCCDLCKLPLLIPSQKDGYE